MEIDRPLSLRVIHPICEDPTNITNLGDNPPPTCYNMKSDFDGRNPHGRAFSFGIAREAYSKVYIKENLTSDPSIPGPGTYALPPKIGLEAQKYSIKGRTLNHRKLLSYHRRFKNTDYPSFSVIDNYSLKSRPGSL